MHSAKHAARELIEQLPESVTWNEVQSIVCACYLA